MNVVTPPGSLAAVASPPCMRMGGCAASPSAASIRTLTGLPGGVAAAYERCQLCEQALVELAA